MGTGAVISPCILRSRPFSGSAHVLQKSEPTSEVPSVNGRKLTPQEAKVEAAKLAMSSLKDVGSLFSSGNDDAVQPIDTTPIFENHSLFGSLNVIHQGQVVKELQEKYDKKWTKMTENEKKLGYYIAYGNWGVREKFDKWASLDAPWDLPFNIPSQIRTSTPNPTDQIHKLEPVFLAETEVRKPQFDTKKMDPVSKTFIYITALVIMLALARDKNIGEEGKPIERITEDPYAKKKAEQQRKLEKEKEAELALANARKWYYLWLK
ncbi:hypothetical protein JCM33374_g5486 [Metschnikowia sp. JCM 33374]|nr:hypothetical protein JCM33374_g5486 [Metschnikowia sp. JCM 33374]